MSKVIELNTTLLVKEEPTFMTHADNQVGVLPQVFERKRAMTRSGLPGGFHLDEMPSASRVMPQIGVTPDVDANRILNVCAQDESTGVLWHDTQCERACRRLWETPKMDAWTPVKLTGVSDVTRVGEDGFPSRSMMWQSPQTKADADLMK